MSKKKIELSTNVEMLIKKYLDLNDLSLDELTNRALKAYLVNHLSSTQVKEALKQADESESSYSNKLFQSNIDDLNKL
ncbi:hypothetical protein SAMN04487792_1115 [Lactobacillus bombicola]|jgi:hypothetical protein|uniref:Uncharacterized protein n=1 Tax=Lactobacillus bombicola TaxID=1505723 RepID=A0A1I1SXZ7_9LACO|nr:MULTISPECIES: hypothetical protein [Lactobacillus]MCO6527509.1 hypothetical protein [Lactobacillus sp.]RHW50390.1 hypothetical protein DS834_06995 [Lactobacillus bombicola]RHW52637.1 hypothetical protein DS833_00960 [Lactobacillus bombicola]RHW53828.1 hypothetical protein DS835_06915 [Lactobacillus bombicola]RMC40313.1 hypothetical protein F5ESL0233_07795 [Lactobacillus sp. ESL0233]